MKCQCCNQQEAAITISFRQDEQAWGLHVCSACGEMMRQLAATAFGEIRRRSADGQTAGEIPGLFSPVADSIQPSPQEQADDSQWEAVRRRREQLALNARLQDAVAREDYETAARLRDEISQQTKEEVQIRI